MHGNVEEFNEISRIYSKNRKIVIERIFPHRMICSTSQANVRYGLCVYADVCQSADQRWRDILIQQQAHRYTAAGFL